MVFQSLGHARANIAEFCHPTDPEIRLRAKWAELLPSNIYADIFKPTLQDYIEKQCVTGEEVNAKIAGLRDFWSIFHDSFTACEEIYSDSIVPTITKLNAPVSARWERNNTTRIVPMGPEFNNMEGENSIEVIVGINMVVDNNQTIVQGENDLILDDN